jgi:hypothetical protein
MKFRLPSVATFFRSYRKKKRCDWIAAGVVVAVLLPSSAGAAAFQPIGLSVDGGEEAWHAEPSFALRWSNPPGVAAVHYRLLDPTGEVVLQEAKIGWPATSIDHLAVPNIVGAYTAEVWLEDGMGNAGPTASARLRFDDAPPGAVAPLEPGAWIGRDDFPLKLRLTHPTEPLPLSGIRGYAISIDRDPDGVPCEGATGCSEADTDLQGGIEADTLELAELPEGVDYAHAVAVTGSWTRSASAGSATLRVDETYPTTELAGVPDGWSRAPVKLVATATDGASGMSQEDGGPMPFTAIRVDGGVPLVSPGERASTTVIGSGAHIVAFYARDAAGNVGDGSLTGGLQNPQPRTETVRIDRDPPALAFANAQNPDAPERIEARVGDALSGIDPATGEISVRAVGSGASFEPLPTQLAGLTMSAHWESEAYPSGEYEFRAGVFDRAGNRGSTTARANGSAMRLSNPLKVPSRLTAELSSRGHTESCRRSAGFGGRLLVGRGAPLAGETVRVVERFASGSQRRERAIAVRTGDDGSFGIRLRPGPSRTVRAVFPSTATEQGSESPASFLAMRPCVSLRVSSPTARVGGRPVVFSGRVRAPGAATASGPVQLQFRLPGLSWSEFRTAQADEHGRFRYAYRFADDDSRGVRFRFRAFVAARAGWPFVPAGSRPVEVLGR